MKKTFSLFLACTLIAISSIAQVSQWPSLNLYSAAGQVQIRANINYAVNRATDSLGKELRKADTALYKTLPFVTKEVFNTITNINTIINTINSRIAALELIKDDTTWKDALTELQKDYNTLAQAQEELNVKLADLKLWSDRIKAIGILNFK